MSEKGFAKAIHKINYDLISDSVADEEISEPRRKDMDRILSFWEQKLFEKIARSSPDNGDALSYFMENDSQDQIAKEIITEVCPEEATVYNFDLKKLVREIGSKIFAFSFLLIQFQVSMKIKTLKDYITYVVNMLKSNGRLNFKNIGLYLLEKKELKNEDKFIISCYLCLEYKVMELFNKLAPSFVKKFVKESDKKDIFLLMTLWYFHFQKKKERFDIEMRKLKVMLNEPNDTKDYVCFMLWAIKMENEVAVQYIWNQLFEDDDKKNPHEFAKLALYNLNTVCYFVSKIICDDQIENFYVNHGYELLDLLSYDSRWYEYFMPTSEYILKYINKMNFICALRTLLQCWIVNDCKRELYICYFDEFISKFNVKMNKNVLFSKIIVLEIILELENRENINLLLDINNDDDIKKLFENGLIIQIGLELVRAKNIKIFATFIENVLKEDEIQKFKNDFFHLTIDEINSLWGENDRDSIEEFKNKFCM